MTAATPFATFDFDTLPDGRIHVQHGTDPVLIEPVTDSDRLLELYAASAAEGAAAMGGVGAMLVLYDHLDLQLTVLIGPPGSDRWALAFDDLRVPLQVVTDGDQGLDPDDDVAVLAGPQTCEYLDPRWFIAAVAAREASLEFFRTRGRPGSVSWTVPS